LRSAPYVDYGTNYTPEICDGKSGINVGLGGFFSRTTPLDAGSDVDRSGFTFLGRGRIMESAEIGYSMSTILRDEDVHSYHTLDGKVLMAKQPVILGVDIATGFGSGEVGFTPVLKFALLAGLPLLNETVTFYAAPRLAAIYYVWKREYFEGVIGWDTYYALCPLYGLSTGVSASVPLGGLNLKLKPELTYLLGHEPQLQEIDFSILRPSCDIVFAF
jgi:hypothetical protein